MITVQSEIGDVRGKSAPPRVRYSLGHARCRAGWWMDGLMSRSSKQSRSVLRDRRAKRHIDLPPNDSKRDQNGNTPVLSQCVVRVAPFTSASGYACRVDPSVGSIHPSTQTSPPAHHSPRRRGALPTHTMDSTRSVSHTIQGQSVAQPLVASAAGGGVTPPDAYDRLQPEEAGQAQICAYPSAG